MKIYLLSCISELSFHRMGKVVKVENFNVETLFGHGVLRLKCKLQLNVDTFDKGC